jgi:hypothetical protein
LVVELVAAFPARPLVIALDRPSVAGASTVGADLGVRLSASVVAGDHFYREMPEKQRWALTAAQASRSTSTWQQLRHEVLELLRAGRSARCRPYNWLPGDGLGERWVMVDPAPLYPVLRRSDRRRAPASGRGAPGGLGGVRLATAGVG